MESRAYNFSTARKRSTQMEQKVIYFPREDDNAPRTKILSSECPSEFQQYRDCLKKFGEESKCQIQKESLNECGRGAFTKVNTDTSYVF